MEGKIKSYIVLLLTGIISAAGLTLMADYAYPKIEQNRAEELRIAILSVMPGVESYTVIDKDKKIYKAVDAKQQIVGYVFAAQGGGYQGIIKMLISVNPTMKNISGIIILENIETPGLGAKISTQDFQEQFKGIPFQSPVEYVLNKKPQETNQIQAITGATISSRAVVNIVNKGMEEIKLYKSDGLK